MAEFNYLNLPGLHRAAQGAQINKFNYERAQLGAEREDEAYDENQKLANTRWLAGATKVLRDIYARDPDEFYVAADELGRAGIEKGIIDPDSWDPQLITIDKVEDIHNQAMVGLGGQPIHESDTTAPAKVRQYEFYKSNVAGDPESEEIWNQSTQVDKGMKTVGIPMPDGSEITVNYDPQTGRGYDLQTGAELIVRPGGGGEVRVYGDSGLLGGGMPKAAAPQGFGRSQTPRQKKEDEVAVTEEIKREKVVNQQITALENAFRLQPMMQAALGGADAWNTGWGSLLKVMPASSAKDLDAQITTIKANIGFDRLQRMRAESPTGGALGQVAVQELVALQSTIANLDQSQSTDAFKGNMRVVLQQYDSWVRAWSEAIMKEGTRDQKMRYYQMIPAGSKYMHPDGTWRVKQ